mgnify:CR=1 FL=1
MNVIDQGEKDSSEFLKIKMDTTEPQPGNFILSVACPIVRLSIYVGPSCPGAQKLEGAEAPI